MMIIPAYFDPEVSTHLHRRGLELERKSYLDYEDSDWILRVEF